MTPVCLPTGPLGVNTYIVPCSAASGFDRVFIVDPGAEAGAIVERGGGAQVTGIVLTHGHFDHIGAVPELKELYKDAPLCIHTGDLGYTGTGAYERHRSDFMRVGASYLIDEFAAACPVFPEADIVFDIHTPQTAVLSFAPEWTVLHTPGHSPGSICLYHKDGVLLSGDTLFASGFGRTDLTGGSYEQLCESLAALFKLPDDTRVYPGHGPFTTIGKEK